MPKLHTECKICKTQELPTARLVIDPQGAMAKYRLEADVTEAGMAMWCDVMRCGTFVTEWNLPKPDNTIQYLSSWTVRIYIEWKGVSLGMWIFFKVMVRRSSDGLLNCALAGCSVHGKHGMLTIFTHPAPVILCVLGQASLVSFVQDFEAGRLKKYLQSETRQHKWGNWMKLNETGKYTGIRQLFHVPFSDHPLWIVVDYRLHVNLRSRCPQASQAQQPDCKATRILSEIRKISKAWTRMNHTFIIIYIILLRTCWNHIRVLP